MTEKPTLSLTICLEIKLMYLVSSTLELDPKTSLASKKKWKGVCEFNNLKTNARGIAIFIKDSIAPINQK